MYKKSGVAVGSLKIIKTRGLTHNCCYVILNLSRFSNNSLKNLNPWIIEILRWRSE